MRKLLVCSAIIAVSVSVPAVADPQAAPAIQSSQTGPADQVICERQEDTGSRLSSHKICHTRSQWAEIRRDDRSDVERAQSQRALNSGK